MALQWRRGIFFLRMSKAIYNRLEILSPWFLRKDVFKYAKSNNYPAESLQSLTDVELLKLKMVQLYVLPQSQKRIIQQEKRAIGKACEEVQLVSNFATYTAPRVSRNALTLGKIPISYEIFEVAPVLSSGEGSWTEWIQTWGNAGGNFGNVDTSLTNSRRQGKKSQCRQRP